MPVKLKMESFRRETELFLLNQQQAKVDKSPKTFGYRLLVVLHLFSGQQLQVPPTQKLKRVWKIAAVLLKLILLSSTTFCLARIVIYLVKHIGNIKFAVYLAAGVIGVGECLFRMIYTELRQKRIEEIFHKMQVALHYSIDGKDNKAFVQRISRCITLSTTIFSSMLFVSMGMNFLTVAMELVRLVEELKAAGKEWDDQEMLDNQVSIEVVAGWACFQIFYDIASSTVTIKLITTLFYVMNLLSMSRVILSDVLFYSWYFIIIHQYEQLACSLKSALGADGDSTKKLSEWIEFHHFINQVLLELNALSSPVIVLAVLATGLQVCMMSFAMHDDVNMVFFMIFGLSSVYQVLIYCVIGQKIRNQAKKMHSKAYKGPWLVSSEAAQQAALMICTVANEKVGHSLPGAPFFALSLEFFASMLSAAITYFVILIQMK